MYYYKDTKNNDVYAYDDEQVKDGLIRKNLVKMTDEEIYLHLNPHLTREQQIAEADEIRKYLITEANQKTQLWQTQLMLGIITDEDKASLTEWMLYVQKVQAVDTLTAPDIIWPEKPE